MKNKLFLTSLLFLLLGTYEVIAQSSFSSKELQLELDQKGFIRALIYRPSNKNYQSTDTIAPLLQLVIAGKNYLPAKALYNKSKAILSLYYPEIKGQADIKVSQHATHIVLELINAVPKLQLDAVIWGPIPTTINHLVGEVIGVVRDKEVAIGIQVLNAKTLGGNYPNKEGSTWARGIAATPFSWGSTLQAYSINRDKNRTVDAWGGVQKNMPVPALKGESVNGSKLAFFGCAEKATLDRLGEIELAEGLPHPTINGVWFKKSPYFGKSYLISSFAESDIDEMIAYTKRAGLISLYHEGPFTSWGHFELDAAQFPNGRKGMKLCADKAKAAGLFLGVHTLTNFLTTNDAYVSPVPDDRLSMTGSSTLVAAIDAVQKEIEVASPEYFSPQEGNELHAVKIGKEIIRYRSVSKEAPYRLLDCQRGAYGTTAAAHARGILVGKLFDHPYKVFFPDFTLQREVASNIAGFLNETGVNHLDFDGHEGALAAGQGDYALEIFAKDVYDQVKHDFIAGTSLSKTFYWHIGSYYNWGEPWYGGFKESMQQYRIDNQGLFQRNLMPPMLGWYLLTATTTLPEMEWMLARAAGYGAGFAMVARPDALRKNPRSGQLLDAIREWELARNSGAFTQEQQDRLKNPASSFHLKKNKEGNWTLLQYESSPLFKREHFIRQPGEPTHSIFNLEQNWKEQLLQFRLNAEGKQGSVQKILIQVDDYYEFSLPVELAAGESLVSEGSREVLVYDAKGNHRQTIQLDKELPKLLPGKHKIILDCSFTGEEKPVVYFQVNGLSREETITRGPIQ
ncbi:hypothetical protein [Flavihumibacter sp. CACIAM 22H1]|uniref:hypothetical protein n=1 Tax=Flavihumibacter sp. CACIAM 22H1 TaxID=1812911 RepID=UPI0007A8009C|nr:hypothetical protein [Flavihumibacter sp. CACIAM 22H1]KYP13748.1 MAG: hypothetical protein A1D16_18935 [Flavihumibacter sp. CACIAM 22H1]